MRKRATDYTELIRELQFVDLVSAAVVLLPSIVSVCCNDVYRIGAVVRDVRWDLMRGGKGGIMSVISRFDQRVVALVELRGTRIEYEMLENALTERGWPVLERHGGDPSEVTEHRVWYTIEVRFPGSYINAVRGALERIEALSDELVLDLNVEVADRVDRDPVDRPRWFVYEPPDAQPPTGLLPWRRRLVARWRPWQAEKLGVCDTGRLITATSVSAAQHLAARPLPGAATPSHRIAVRMSMGATPHRVSNYGRRRESGRVMLWLALFVVVALWVGARIAEGYGQGFGSWGWVAAVGIGFLFTLAEFICRALPEISRVGSLVISGASSLIVMGAGAHMARIAPTAGYGSRAIVYCTMAGLVLNGIRLLVRQWSWQRTASWLLPALLPISMGFLPSLGLGLHTSYLDAFGLNLEDVEVPKAYGFLASLKLAVCGSLVLIALAILGYMKHFHWYVKDRWFGNFMLFVVSLTLLLAGMGGLGLMSASKAGFEAVAVAKKGRNPAPYFGVSPEWVCVRAVGKVADVPVDGGELVPSRPYLKVGDGGGTVALWGGAEGKVIKVPMSKLRIVPMDSRPTTCR